MLPVRAMVVFIININVIITTTIFARRLLCIIFVAHTRARFERFVCSHLTWSCSSAAKILPGAFACVRSICPVYTQIIPFDRGMSSCSIFASPNWCVCVCVRRTVCLLPFCSMLPRPVSGHVMRHDKKKASRKTKT